MQEIIQTTCAKKRKSVDASIQEPEDYINKSKGKLLTVSSNNTDDIRKNKLATKTRTQKWEEKLLYEYFKRQSKEISYKKSWTLLRKGNLTRETESLLIAAQNKVKSNIHIKAKIDHGQPNNNC